jgi:hypothetical protein
MVGIGWGIRASAVLGGQSIKLGGRVIFIAALLSRR